MSDRDLKSDPTYQRMLAGLRAELRANEPKKPPAIEAPRAAPVLLGGGLLGAGLTNFLGGFAGALPSPLPSPPPRVPKPPERECLICGRSFDADWFLTNAAVCIFHTKRFGEGWRKSHYVGERFKKFSTGDAKVISIAEVAIYQLAREAK